MANELVISGILFKVYATEVKSEKFSKREFVVKIDKDVNGTIYSEYAKFQVMNAKCDSLNDLVEGSEVEVKFNLSGKPWTNKEGVEQYFTNLNAWSVKVIGQVAQSNKPNPHALPPLPPKKVDTKPQIQDNSGADDLPF
jgi:hypothetical protein